MIPQTLQLEVVTPERHLVREQVNEVQMPGLQGYLGILPGHAPLITELGMGELTYKKGTQAFHLSVMGGYAEVLADRVIVLADVGELAEEIDVDRARSARERAEQRLARPTDPEVDWARASLALQRAVLRLQVASKGGAASVGAEEHHRTHA
jgi:F-type H+-transporting ATPase subunit epsilon